MQTEGSHIGTLIKSHGYKGTLVLAGEPEIISELTEGTPLFIEISRQRIPFFIEEISIDGSGKRCMIKFEFIDSENEARRYISCDVYSDQHNASPESQSEFQRLIGYNVKDQYSGSHFIVRDFFDNPENPLLILEPFSSHTSEKSTTRVSDDILLPARADYILKIDHRRKKIKANFPEGLIE